MKKKKYITPCVQLEQLGNVFDEEFDVDEDYEYEIPLL